MDEAHRIVLEIERLLGELKRVLGTPDATPPVPCQHPHPLARFGRTWTTLEWCPDCEKDRRAAAAVLESMK